MMNNNETFGITIEKLICEIFNLKNNISNLRCNQEIKDEFRLILEEELKKNNIIITEYVGENGNENDFMIENETLQVKTNYNNSLKVCPSKIGQSTKRTFIINIAKKIKKDVELKDDIEIKEFIINNIKEILMMYIDAYFTSDYLLYIRNDKKNRKEIKIYRKEDKIVNEKNYEKCKFRFTKDIKNWNESTTLKVEFEEKIYSLGEFQIHNHRNNVKFRFNNTNLHNFLNEINKI